MLHGGYIMGKKDSSQRSGTVVRGPKGLGVYPHEPDGWN